MQFTIKNINGKHCGLSPQVVCQQLCTPYSGSWSRGDNSCGAVEWSSDTTLHLWCLLNISVCIHYCELIKRCSLYSHKTSPQINLVNGRGSGCIIIITKALINVILLYIWEKIPRAQIIYEFKSCLHPRRKRLIQKRNRKLTTAETASFACCCVVGLTFKIPAVIGSNLFDLHGKRPKRRCISVCASFSIQSWLASVASARDLRL